MTTKICTKCKQEKEITEFSKVGYKRKRKTGNELCLRQSWCKKCTSEKAYDTLKKNPTRYKRTLERANLLKASKRKILTTLIDKIKLEKKCALCGFNSHPKALTFHHLDPSEKGSSVSDLVFHFPISKIKTKDFSTIEREIEKCIVLCANCHTAFHLGLIELPKKEERLADISPLAPLSNPSPLKEVADSCLLPPTSLCLNLTQPEQSQEQAREQQQELSQPQQPSSTSPRQDA